MIGICVSLYRFSWSLTYWKVSTGSLSERGARDTIRVYSVPESFRKRGELPFRQRIKTKQ